MDIFISYARKDLSFAKQIAEAIQRKGWSVWWDARIKTAQQWDEVIEKHLQSARLVIVLWFKTSVTRRWVKNEARYAHGKGILEPVLIDDVEIPLEFTDLQSVYLAHWTGDEADPNFTQLVEAISEVLNPEQTNAARQENPSKCAEMEQQALAAGGSVGVEPKALPNLAVFTDVHTSWCPQMVILPPGEFIMGSPDSDKDAYPDEKPQHRVVIGYRFAIGQYLVMFAEYDLFAKATGRDYPGDATWGRARRPVINVTWEDAKAYAEWLSQKTGNEYRLPSEAEWEYACRAGTITRYAFGDELADDLANFGGQVGKTTKVGSYITNPWGLYDMHGNVCEWVQDIWHDNYDCAPDDGNPWVDDSQNEVMVIRGGSWSDYRRTVRSAVRGREPATHRSNFVGFRMARTL